jgi:hypothetical protein
MSTPGNIFHRASMEAAAVLVSVSIGAINTANAEKDCTEMHPGD